ncbi:MAG: helix-turn-helix domain-containing protein [Candidatus Dormibacteria bacterium]
MSANTVNAGAVHWARQQRTGGPAEKAVLLILAAKADPSGTCSLSTRTIAAGVDISQATARRTLERLRNRGLVSWSSGSGRSPATYRLPL